MSDKIKVYCFDNGDTIQIVDNIESIKELIIGEIDYQVFEGSIGDEFNFGIEIKEMIQEEYDKLPDAY